MGAHTERRLDGYKLFVHNEAEKVVVYAVTDGWPPTRLVHELDAETAWEFGQDVCNAARRAVTYPAVHGVTTADQPRPLGPK